MGFVVRTLELEFQPNRVQSPGSWTLTWGLYPTHREHLGKNIDMVLIKLGHLMPRKQSFDWLQHPQK